MLRLLGVLREGPRGRFHLWGICSLPVRRPPGAAEEYCVEGIVSGGREGMSLDRQHLWFHTAGTRRSTGGLPVPGLIWSDAQFTISH